MRTTYLLLALVSFCIASAWARDSVSAAEVNGTFRAKGGSEFRIWALGNGKLQVEFSGIYRYKDVHGDPTANMGDASGTAQIDGDSAIFKPKEFAETCTIVLKFTKPGSLEVEEHGENCGFGMHVTAAGTYRKASSHKPKFGETREG